MASLINDQNLIIVGSALMNFYTGSCILFAYAENRIWWHRFPSLKNLTYFIFQIYMERTILLKYLKI